MEVSTDILEKIRPAVYDFYSVTARHFLNAGEAGIKQFHLLRKALIGDINNISVDEVKSMQQYCLRAIPRTRHWLDHTELFQPVLLVLKLLTSSCVT